MIPQEHKDRIKNHLIKNTYSVDGKVWYKKNKSISDDVLLKEVIPLIENDAEYNPIKLIPSFLEELKNDFLIDEEEDEDKFNSFSWEERWTGLLIQRWSKLDEDVWGGLKWTMVDDAPVVVARTGNGEEYQTVGASWKDVYGQLHLIPHPINGNRLKYCDDNIIVPLLRFSNSPRYKFLDENQLDGDILPASVAGILYHKNFIKEGDEVIGAGIKCVQKPSTEKYIEHSFEAFLGNRDNFISKIIPISNDPKVPTFRYLSLNVKHGPTPTFDQWCSSFYHPKESRSVLLQFIGSMIVSSNAGSQLLWIQGMGGDGKSVFAEALLDYFGIAGCATNISALKEQFGLANIENKRLAVFSDNKNPNLVKESIIHSITGMDTVSIRRLYKQAYKSTLIAKILVLENGYPSINYEEQNQTRRCILLKIKPPTNEEKSRSSHYALNEEGNYVFIGDNSFKTRFKSEIEHIVALAIDEYRAKVRGDDNIVIPAVLSDMMKSNTEDATDIIINRFVEDAFIPGNINSYITAITVNNMINKFCEINRIQVNRFIHEKVTKIIQKNHPATTSFRKTIDSKKVTVWTRININPKYNITNYNEENEQVIGVEDEDITSMMRSKKVMENEDV